MSKVLKKSLQMFLLMAIVAAGAKQNKLDSVLRYSVAGSTTKEETVDVSGGGNTYRNVFPNAHAAAQFKVDHKIGLKEGLLASFSIVDPSKFASNGVPTQATSVIEIWYNDVTCNDKDAAGAMQVPNVGPSYVTAAAPFDNTGNMNAVKDHANYVPGSRGIEDYMLAKFGMNVDSSQAADIAINTGNTTYVMPNVTISPNQALVMVHEIAAGGGLLGTTVSTIAMDKLPKVVCVRRDESFYSAAAAAAGDSFGVLPDPTNDSLPWEQFQAMRLSDKQTQGMMQYVTGTGKLYSVTDPAVSAPLIGHAADATHTYTLQGQSGNVATIATGYNGAPGRAIRDRMAVNGNARTPLADAAVTQTAIFDEWVLWAKSHQSRYMSVGEMIAESSASAATAMTANGSAGALFGAAVEAAGQASAGAKRMDFLKEFKAGLDATVAGLTSQALQTANGMNVFTVGADGKVTPAASRSDGGSASVMYDVPGASPMGLVFELVGGDVRMSVFAHNGRTITLVNKKQGNDYKFDRAQAAADSSAAGFSEVCRMVVNSQTPANLNDYNAFRALVADMTGATAVASSEDAIIQYKRERLNALKGKGGANLQSLNAAEKADHDSLKTELDAYDAQAGTTKATRETILKVLNKSDATEAEVKEATLKYLNLFNATKDKFDVVAKSAAQPGEVTPLKDLFKDGKYDSSVATQLLGADKAAAQAIYTSKSDLFKAAKFDDFWALIDSMRGSEQKKVDESAAAKKKADEAAAAKKKADDEAAAAAKKKSDEEAAGKEKKEGEGDEGGDQEQAETEIDTDAVLAKFVKFALGRDEASVLKNLKAGKGKLTDKGVIYGAGMTFNPKKLKEKRIATWNEMSDDVLTALESVKQSKGARQA